MYCKSNKFIYVHLPKCAGTFLKHFLLSNIYQDYEEAPRLSGVRDFDFYHKEHDTVGEFSLEQIINKFNLNSESYFKFSVVRNPWDRVVSMYNFLGGRLPLVHDQDFIISSGRDREVFNFLPYFEFYSKDNFDGFVNHCFVLGKLRDGYYESCTKRLSLNGSLSVDKCYKLENIDNAINDLADKLNFKDPKVFTDWRKNSNAAFRKKGHYRDYYSNWSKEIVRRHFLIDIDNFNYSF